MLFNSLEFLIFLPVAFIIYWMAPKKLRLQNFLVVIASYIFYGWWSWRFLLLIAGTTLCCYICGLLIEKWRDTRRKFAKQALVVSIVLNLAVLCTYKYFDFFAANLASLLSFFGVYLDDMTLGLVLPVGISFYTLQALSYTIDVYRGRLSATRDLLAFTAFISFFPQLVAGPIERAGNLLPQFMRRRHFDYAAAVDGMRQILWGLFKKMVVADNCAIAANMIFGDYQNLSGGMLLWGAFFFTFQIYGDFSGYSDIAIGTARLFGINLCRNFHFPYLSRDIAEFWRRWHISLNTWFVDYVYIPLGGSRGTMTLTAFNTLVIFLLSGFWHGANWTFICWGLFNALLFIPLIFTRKTKRFSKSVVAQNRTFPTLVEVIQVATTFILVMFGWIIFRAGNITQAAGYISRIFTDFNICFPVDYKRSVAVVTLLFAAEYLQRRREFALQLQGHGLMRYRAARWILYYCIIAVIVFWSAPPESFIYFQF